MYNLVQCCSRKTGHYTDNTGHCKVCGLGMLQKEWIDLFLVVADMCDGGECKDRHVIRAYNKLLKTSDGDKIYGDAVNARGLEVFGTE